MSFAPLPEHVAPFKLCSQHAVIKGSVPLKNLKRLGGLLSKRQGQVRAELTFGLDSENRCRIDGRVRATLVVQCQRCLDDTSLTIDSMLSVGVYDSDAPVQCEDLDCVQTQDSVLDLKALVEDELILSLPIVAYHERKDCNEMLVDLRRSGVDEAERESPFAVLGVLKGKQDNLKQ